VAAPKFTRKDLKQDSFVERTAQAYDFLQRHYLKLAIGVLAIVVVAFGWSFYAKGQARAAERASYLLYQGQSLLYRGAYAEAVSRLRECIDSYAGTDSALRAHLDLGHALLAQGDQMAALDALQDGIAKTSAEDPLYFDFRLAEASALVDNGQHTGAEVVYRNLLASDPADHQRVELSLRLADCLKLDDRLPEAVAVLEQLQQSVETGQITAPGQDIESRLQLYRALTK
jgi:predicted negative regulator of RcsB-dependent stress response